jgi:hypothetical protein
MWSVAVSLVLNEAEGPPLSRRSVLPQRVA